MDRSNGTDREDIDWRTADVPPTAKGMRIIQQALLELHGYVHESVEASLAVRRDQAEIKASVRSIEALSKGTAAIVARLDAEREKDRAEVRKIGMQTDVIVDSVRRIGSRLGIVEATTSDHEAKLRRVSTQQDAHRREAISSADLANKLVDTHTEITKRVALTAGKVLVTLIAALLGYLLRGAQP